jgi:hypothetical protein
MAPAKEGKMKPAAKPIILALALAALGCSTVSVTTDYDPEADFGSYRTFAWIKAKPKLRPRRAMDAALMDKRIRSAVEGELLSKGYTRATGRPDFLIAYHVGAENKVDVDHYGYRYGSRGRWRGHRVEVRRYKEGTLILDIVDPGMNQLVWRGTGSGNVYHPSDFERKIVEAVREILEEFPPGD